MGTGSGMAVLAGTLMLAASCAGNHGASSAPGDDSYESPARRVGSGVVIEGPALGGNDRTILNVLRQKVAGMNVAYDSACPVITLRGHNSIHGSPNPAVFVNDTRSTNTCILGDLRMSDIERLEVYPTGIGPSPSYGANANGLILVYTRREEL